MSNRDIILDTETTGLDPRSGHRIIEIGCLEMRDKVLTGEKFHIYINPERDVPHEAYRVHGISSEFLQDKPLFKEVADDFMRFVDGGRLVIHNAPFDLKFLNYELSLLGLSSLEGMEVIDTLPMARKKYPGARASLDALCKRFKIDNSNRTLHGALLDAELLAEVYVELTGGRQSSFTMQKNGAISSEENETRHNVMGNGIVVTPTEEEEHKYKKLMEKIMG